MRSSLRRHTCPTASEVWAICYRSQTTNDGHRALSCPSGDIYSALATMVSYEPELADDRQSLGKAIVEFTEAGQELVHSGLTSVPVRHCRSPCFCPKRRHRRCLDSIRQAPSSPSTSRAPNFAGAFSERSVEGVGQTSRSRHSPIRGSAAVVEHRLPSRPPSREEVRR